jgi:ADP-ribose pyrophosphatase
MAWESGHLVWKETSRKKLASCSVFDFNVSHRIAGDGRKGDFAFITCPDWVNVVPVLRDGSGAVRFLMVRQYRHGIEQVTTEFPAGMVDAGEEPVAAASRELLEETGRTAGKLTFLGRISASPAFMTNWCHTFLAEDLRPAGDQNLDEMEILDVVEVPERELLDSLGKGEYVNSLVMTALLWYTLRKAPTR